MADNINRKCIKCGRSPKQVPGIKLSRFPKPGPRNAIRCESLARYCFPNSPWSSQKFQEKLYYDHKMLCNEHVALALQEFMGPSTSQDNQVTSEPGPSFCNVLKDVTNTDAHHDKIGIIGGSGFDDPSLFESRVERDVSTPFGKPSDVLIEGQLGGVPCVLLARHGRKHHLQPSDVNYRANIWALKEAGCSHVLATTATGSLVEEYAPGDLVILDDFIDRTWGRKCTFYDNTPGGPRGVCHLPMAPAFCPRGRQALYSAAQGKGNKVHRTGTAVVIQGPRFSSRAESLMHKQWGGHLVNMTTVPEVVLAKEAGLSYAAVALVTDYDCWRPHETSVSVSEVLATFSKNVKKAAQVIIDAVQLLAADDNHDYLEEHRNLVASSVMLKE